MIAEGGRLETKLSMKMLKIIIIINNNNNNKLNMSTMHHL